jgi:hypothetical protein
MRVPSPPNARGRGGTTERATGTESTHGPRRPSSPDENVREARVGRGAFRTVASGLVRHEEEAPSTGKIEDGLTALAGWLPGEGVASPAVKGERRGDPVRAKAAPPAPARGRRTGTAGGLPGPPGPHGETPAHRAPDTRTGTRTGSCSTHQVVVWNATSQRSVVIPAALPAPSRVVLPGKQRTSNFRPFREPAPDGARGLHEQDEPPPGGEV